MKTTLKLKPGKFYQSRDGFVWCCFRMEPGRGAAHERAACVRVSDGRVECFYGDGRSDFAGTSSTTLVREMQDEVRAMPKLTPVATIICSMVTT